MKKLFIIIIPIIGFINIYGSNNSVRSPKPLTYDEVQKQNYEKQKSELCGYFSQLVSNFLNIVQNPHNSAQVSGNIAGAFDNIVKIAMSCIGRAINRVKRHGTPLNADDIEQIKYMITQELAEYEDIIRAAIVQAAE